MNNAKINIERAHSVGITWIELAEGYVMGVLPSACSTTID